MMTPKNALIAAFLIAWGAVAGSLYSSEILGFEPCALCWWQRIAMYPIAVILAVALVRRDVGAWRYVLPFSVIGAGIAAYHYALQKVPGLSAPQACGEGVPCDLIYVNILGFITIPLLSLAAFVVITGCMLYAAKVYGRQ